MDLTYSIIYEQPVNERIRSFLRFEQVFKQAVYFLEGQSVWDTRHALMAIFEMIETVDRNDLKSETTKELERFCSRLLKLQRQPDLDHAKLSELIENNQALSQSLHEIEGKPGNSLREHELFKGIRHKTTLPGGPCSFDMPAYHFWLHQPSEQRYDLLVSCLKEFDSLYSAIKLILTLIRQSAPTELAIAKQGNMQKTLNSALPVQLIRVFLSKETPCFPEISAGKHQFSIQFKQMDKGKIASIGLDVEFKLASCAF